jgi:hypothetical protein
MIPRKAQRLYIECIPGSLLKGRNVRNVHLSTPRTSDGDRDESYLRDVRQCPCLHCGLDGFSEAAHVRLSSGYHRKASGMGKKPADKWAVPLCAEHHRLARDAQHNRSEREFWDDLGINPLAACERLWAKRGDVVAMRAMAHVIIAERCLR